MKMKKGTIFPHIKYFIQEALHGIEIWVYMAVRILLHLAGRPISIFFTFCFFVVSFFYAKYIFTRISGAFCVGI